MARTQSANPNSSPDFIAWHVQTKGEKSFWTKVGASWNHKDGKGMTLQLESLPIGGRIVLREPSDESTTETGARA